MAFSRVNPAGWAMFEVLTSAQMNALDIDHANAVDGADGGTYNPTAGLTWNEQVTIDDSGHTRAGPAAALDVTPPLASSGGTIGVNVNSVASDVTGIQTVGSGGAPAMLAIGSSTGTTAVIAIGNGAGTSEIHDYDGIFAKGASGQNGRGITSIGSGNESGGYFEGGSTDGTGIVVEAGGDGVGAAIYGGGASGTPTAGVGLYVKPTTSGTGAYGIDVVGEQAFAAIRATGAAGPGLLANGGTGFGAAIYGGTNADGLYCRGDGTGDGINVAGGTTGVGILCTASGSTTGIDLNGGTGTGIDIDMGAGTGVSSTVTGAGTGVSISGVDGEGIDINITGAGGGIEITLSGAGIGIEVDTSSPGTGTGINVTSQNICVNATSDNSYAGNFITSGTTALRGYNDSTSGVVYGVAGLIDSTNTSAAAVYGNATDAGRGVYGASSSGAGVVGISTSSYGGDFQSTSDTGLRGLTLSTTGVDHGVYGQTASDTTTAAGVYGYASDDACGVYGSSSSGHGVRGSSSTGHGGWFSGHASGGSSGLSSLHVEPQTSSPTTLSNGDIWVTGSDIYVRIGGASYTLDKTAV